MIRNRLSPSVSLIAFTAALAACTESSSEPARGEAVELGSTGQALSRGHHEHDAHRHQRPKHHHPGRCEQPPPTPAPDPVIFTPATAAARSGRRAGSAVDTGPLSNEPIYAQLLAEQFNALTPENATKWGSLQPVDPNHWDFDQGDVIADFADEHEQVVKGHTLIWHQQLPSFIDANTPPRQLERYSERHIDRTVRHFRRDFAAWDVVNEAVADDGSGLRPTPFSNAFGERYIDRAFQDAQAADRDARLYYNDYGIEGINAKSNAVYDLMKRLLARRVPIDGIGFQGHFDARFVPSLDELVQNLQRFADLGLSVNISELDVQVRNLGGTRAYKLAVQKQLYQRIAAACSQVEACEGITTWGFTDAHSWVDATFGPDDPLLFDELYQKKPAYFGYVDGFLGVPLDDPALEPNLIGNSSLEAGLDGWSAMGSAVLSTETVAAHSGLRSARAGGRSDTWMGPRHDITALARAGRSYDVSVWTRLSGAASANTSLTAQVTCAGQAASFVPVASAGASDADWTQLSGTLQLPECDLQQVAVYLEGPAAGVDLLVDDLALREQPLPNLITNSDFESGTAGWFNFGPDTLGTTSDAHGGSSAAIATARTDTWNGIGTDLTARVAPRATYRAEAFLKIAGAASDRVGLTAAVTCAGQAAQFLTVGSATGSSTDWVRVTGSVTVPNCTVQSFVLYAEGPAAGVDLLLDDVAFWQIDAGPPPSSNVIDNSGFETGTDGWFGFGPVTASSTADRAHGGSRSALISGRTDTWNGLATSLVGRLTPGASYSVSAWAQVGTGSSPVSLTFQNACDGGGATNFTFVSGATVNDSTWTQLQGTLVAPDCTLATGNLYIEGAPAGVDIYLDDVEVQPLP
ncbi:MAG TPA: endo-1,4-beta-xylanase [Polyangiaceae bacterium]|nr:endo-1,4-beta-xylanase [Polyangiaceae bacterium]